VTGAPTPVVVPTPISTVTLPDTRVRARLTTADQVHIRDLVFRALGRACAYSLRRAAAAGRDFDVETRSKTALNLNIFD